MNYKGKECIVEAWDSSGVKMDGSLDESVIKEVFNSVLEKQLNKKGLIISHETSNNPIIVQGKFVRIDKGNRFLRYMIGFFGAAVVEVEGELIADGRRLASLNATERQSMGLFLGGSSKNLLKSCAQVCALKVSKQVISNLKKL